MSKHLLCTVADDGFVAMTRVMLHSFAKHNSWFKGDVLVIHGGDKCPLSEESKEKLSNCCSLNISFEDVGDLYLPIMSRVLKHKGNEQNIRTLVGFYKYEVFRDRGHERSVSLDGDMLIQDDIGYLFDNPSKMLFCLDGIGNSFSGDLGPGEPFPSKYNEINTGMMSVDVSSLDPNFYNILYDFALNYNYANHSLPRNEQTLLSRFLRNRSKSIAPQSYNVIRRGLHSKAFRKGFAKKAKIIHYTGDKPTSPANTGNISFRLNGLMRGYKSVMDLWRNYNKKYFNNE